MFITPPVLKSLWHENESAQESPQVAKLARLYYESTLFKRRTKFTPYSTAA